MDGETKELERCPFCGTVAYIVQDMVGSMCAIRCLEFKCGAVVYFSGVSRRKAETVKRWNRREEKNE